MFSVRNNYVYYFKKFRMNYDNKLPNSVLLPIDNLCASFSNVTNSYKYLWFLSILRQIQKDIGEEISFKELIIEMLLMAWYPINYFNLHFGKQDKLASSIIEIKTALNVDNSIKTDQLRELLLENISLPPVYNVIEQLSRYVPYRFLSPWFSNELRGENDAVKNNIVFERAEIEYNAPLRMPIYKLSQDKRSIILNINWIEYFKENFRIIEDFTYWNYVSYLQKNNPNVPNLQEKLFPPQSRNLKDAKLFWGDYISRNHGSLCVFSQKQLTEDNFSVDHFIPWSFVAHDQLWNLAPVSRNINSSKGNNIPSEKYLSLFATLQYQAFHSAFDTGIFSEGFLEDYTILFADSIHSIKQIEKENFVSFLIKNLKPLMQIAVNSGFRDNWIYKSE